MRDSQKDLIAPQLVVVGGRLDDRAILGAFVDGGSKTLSTRTHGDGSFLSDGMMSCNTGRVNRSSEFGLEENGDIFKELGT